MIGETILARTSARCKQANNWRDNISLIIGLQSAFWWSVNIYCANCWPTIGAPIIVTPLLARSSAVSFNSANPTWEPPLTNFHKNWKFFEISIRHIRFTILNFENLTAYSKSATQKPSVYKFSSKLNNFQNFGPPYWNRHF